MYFLFDSILLFHFLTYMILPPEQGRRTDLLKSSSLVSPNNFGGPVSGIRSCHPHPVSSQNINSDSVHYDPSTQVIVSSGSSCHTVDRLTESTEKDRQSPFPSYSLLAPPPPWVHVFSKSCANSSLRTQCAERGVGTGFGEDMDPRGWGSQ